MPSKYYEDLDIGDKTAPETGRTISESDVYAQAGLSGSYNPIHIDREYMKRTEFGNRLVQNTLLLTVMEGLLRRIPWNLETVAAYGRDSVRFTNPVFIDDTVYLEVEVVDKRPKDKSRGIVTFRQELYNQDDELAAIGDYLLLLRRTE